MNSEVRWYLLVWRLVYVSAGVDLSMWRSNVSFLREVRFWRIAAGTADTAAGQWQPDGGAAQMAAYQRFLHRRFDRWRDEDSRQRYVAMAELRRRTGQVSWQEEQAQQSRQRQQRLTAAQPRIWRLPIIAPRQS